MGNCCGKDEVQDAVAIHLSAPQKIDPKKVAAAKKTRVLDEDSVEGENIIFENE